MPFSPTSWPGGGGVPNADRSIWTGNAVTIANGASGFLTFNTLAGASILDVTNPAAPEPLVGGVYCVAVNARPAGALTVGGWFEVQLELDQDNDDPTLLLDSPPASATLTQPLLTVTATYFVPAGSPIAVKVRNFDGAASRDFQLLQAVIQRLS